MMPPPALCYLFPLDGKSFYTKLARLHPWRPALPTAIMKPARRSAIKGYDYKDIHGQMLGLRPDEKFKGIDTNS